MYISRDLHPLSSSSSSNSIQAAPAITTHMMYSEQMVTPANWNFMNGQLTPKSESSCSSPFDSSTPLSNFLLPLDSETNYYEFSLIDQAWGHTSPKPLTPSHTPEQQNYNILHYKLPLVDDESMPTSNYSYSGRQSDICNEELYGLFMFTTPSTKLEKMQVSPQSTVFSQMPEKANNQHLSATSRPPLGSQARDQKPSMESSSSECETDDSNMKKPSGSNADGGTYTCTYHGCTLRFETPVKLQKHKRDMHRQSAPSVGKTSSAPAASQAGPHKCTRVSPQTGKPCNVIFSRPYDLTRHEDTFHNARKVKPRCLLCKEEKTFSRKDALTRHLKVVHPNSQVPEKS